MTPRSLTERARRFAVAVTVVASVVPASGWLPAAQADPVATKAACDHRNNNTYRKLLECLTLAGVMEHLEAFQDIAAANGDTRASGTPGYDQSVDYVVERLRAAGYDPEVQPFDFPFFQLLSASFSQTAPVQRDFEPFDFTTNEGDFDVMTLSPSGTVSDVEVVPVDVVVPIGDNPPNTSTSGCEPEDFPAEVDGNVALVQRGTCTFFDKALNAQEAGAVAVIVFNEGQPERETVVLGNLGEEAVEALDIPVLGISYALGVEFVETPGTRVSIDVEAISEIRETYNVIAELEGKNDDNVVMLGAHLDSVPEGPGINDNGSGSATILEVAETMARNKPQNTLRFAWWGAEELGLLGSNLYVANLSEAELNRIALYLNFDMVASPNFVRFIYDGDESTFPAPVEVPEGSDAIEEVFQQYYDLRGLAYEDTEFNGRSDYQAFILSDIPAGGLFTGAEGIKTPEQEAIFGGVAGLAYDPCYHSPCDDLIEPNAVPELEAAYGENVLVGNVNTLVLDQNLDAIGYAALTFAYSTEDVNGVPGKPVPGGPNLLVGSSSQN